MTQDDLERLPEWKNLTDKEQTFFTVLIENGGDDHDAVEKSYGSASRQSALTTARRLRGTKRLAPVFNALEGSGPMDRDEILRLASIHARTGSSDQIRLTALKLCAELQGYLNKMAPKPQDEANLEKMMREQVDR